MEKAKSFTIPKRTVMDAWLSVKRKGGSAGVDDLGIEDVEKDLSNHLYKLWNRMSSGSYFPPPVKLVEIPKKSGGTRRLGIPTVIDRVAQMVVKQELEPKLDALFHEDSYGYRPGRSAHDAIGKAQERCYRHTWAIDLDIKGFFDTIDHELMMKAVRWHRVDPWVELYIERWLKAPVADGDTLQERTKGTPQGGVISPLLANLYLHYAFDQWMGREFPDVPFERYADDIVVHVDSEQQAEEVKKQIAERLNACHLTLHPKEDEDRVLQAVKTQGNVSLHQFRFSGIHVQAAGREKPRGRGLCRFCTGNERKLSKGDS